MPTSTALLDTRYQVETPENIDLSLRPAGPVPRALAFAIDAALRVVVGGTLIIGLAGLGKFGVGLMLIVLFLSNWLYSVLFEVLDQGRTPGKRCLGLRVVHDDGTPVGWAASMIRNLLRWVDLLPAAYFLGLLSCLLHPTFKRLGDLAAGTLVVYQEDPLADPKLPEAPPLPPPTGLLLDEQRALLAFAERHGQLSKARRAELAAILAEPLHLTAERAEQQLDGMARALLGPT